MFLNKHLVILQHRSTDTKLLLMKHFLLTLLFLANLSLFAQPSQFFFGNGQFHHINPSSDGYYFLVGESGGKISLKKIGFDAEVFWEQTYDRTDNENPEVGHRLLVLENGDILIVGKSQVDTHSYNALVMRVNSVGEEIWRKPFSNVSAFYDVAVFDEGFLLVGTHGSSFTKGKIVRIDENGGTDWAKDIEHYSETHVKRILPSNDGNYYIIGRTNSIGAGFEGIFIRKINTNGASIWSSVERTNHREGFIYSSNRLYTEPLAAHIEEDGTIWIAEAYEHDPNIALMHFSKNGELLEENMYGGLDYEEYPASLTPLSDGGWLIVGTAKKGIPTTAIMGFAMRLSNQKTEVWRQYYLLNGVNNRLYGGIESYDLGLLLYGTSGNNYEEEGWLLRTESDGNAYPTKVKGKVVVDIGTPNCEIDFQDLALQNWFVTVESKLNKKLLRTNIVGGFEYAAELGDTLQFTLSPPFPKEAWDICENNQILVPNIDNLDPKIQFVVQQVDADCPVLEVGLTQPDLMRCKTSTFFVTTKNKGKTHSTPTTLDIQFDDDLTVESVSIPYSLEEQTLTMEIPTIPSFSEHTIDIEVSLACDVQLGAIHPIKAKLNSPSCDWAKEESHFEVVGECRGDEVVFEMWNTGGKSAKTLVKYRVLADYLAAIKETAVILPASGEKTVLSFPADGRTWRLELENPGTIFLNKKIVKVVEGCGKSNNGLYTVGYQDAFPFYDASPNISTVYPANSTGLPDKISPFVRGLGYYNHFSELMPIEYTARVENSLDEMVNEVRFSLNFSPAIDLSTFELLAANQSATFELLDNSSVQVIMQTLQLEPKEMATCRFRVAPLPDLPATDVGYSMKVEGQAFLNGQESVPMHAANLFYLEKELQETDEFNNYSDEILLYGGSYTESGDVMAVSQEGSVFLGGYTASYADNAYSSGLLTKVDSLGRALWSEAINIDNRPTGIDGIIPLADGGCIVAGDFQVPFSTDYYLDDFSIYIARIGASGKMLWHKKVRPTGENKGARMMKMIQSQDGNFFMFGSVISANSSITKELYLKFDETGEILWQKIQHETGYTPSQGVANSDNGYTLIGSSPHAGSNFSIRRIDEADNELWKTINYSENDTYIGGIAPTHDGGYMVGGTTYLMEDDGNYEPTFWKFSAEGEFLWERKLEVGERHRAWVHQLIPAEDNGFLIAGRLPTSNNTPDVSNQMLLMKIDENANLEWMSSYGGKLTESAEDVLITTQNKIFLWGGNNSKPPAYNKQALLVVTNLEDNLPVSIEPIQNTTPFKTLLYPNPTQSSTNVILSPKPLQSLHWSLYNLSGKVVKEGRTSNGLFEVGVEELGKGMYFLKFLEGKYPSMKLVVE